MSQAGHLNIEHAGDRTFLLYMNRKVLKCNLQLCAFWGTSIPAEDVAAALAARGMVHLDGRRASVAEAPGACVC